MAITFGFVTITSISSCILVLFLERLLTLKWMRRRSFFNKLAVKLDKFEGEKYSSLLLTMQEKLILSSDFSSRPPKEKKGNIAAQHLEHTQIFDFVQGSIVYNLYRYYH